MQAAVLTVDVVHFKLQLLHHLKVVVDDKRLGEAGIKGVLYFLCPANLTQTRYRVNDLFFGHISGNSKGWGQFSPFISALYVCLHLC